MAVIESKKDKPEKSKLLGYLSATKQTLQDTVSSSKAAMTIATWVGEAIDKINTLL